MGQNGPVPDSNTSLAPAPHADLAWGRTWPSLEVFTELALEHRRVIPVVRRVLADAETPVGVYRKLAKDAPGTFLLESAEHGGVWSRYSIVGARSAATLTEKDGRAHWIGEPPVGLPTDGDPTEAVRETVAALATPRTPGLPPLTGGLVGAITYDAVRRWESVPDTGRDELDLPEVAMMLATDLAVFDHSDGSLLLIANAVNHDATDERIEDAWADAVRRLDRMTDELAAAGAEHRRDHRADREPDRASSHTQAQFEEMVEQAKEAIRAGEAFQIVVSQRFTVPCRADALDVYRALRVSNPSPYMYLLRLPHPDGTAYDIVGSQPRGPHQGDGTPGHHPPDRRLAPARQEPRPRRAPGRGAARPTPRSGPSTSCSSTSRRNDLQRICRAGTVDTVDFMSIRRYSHIMHIESTVVGDLRDDRSAYDALVATFPAGTLSGAPKPRAMALIDGYEGLRRGLYGGVVGYLDFAGDLDMAIAIRTALIKDGLGARPGRRRHRRRLGAAPRVRGDGQQGRRRPASRRRSSRAAPAGGAPRMTPPEPTRPSRALDKKRATLVVLVPAALLLGLTTRPWASGRVPRRPQPGGHRGDRWCGRTGRRGSPRRLRRGPARAHDRWARHPRRLGRRHRAGLARSPGDDPARRVATRGDRGRRRGARARPDHRSRCHRIEHRLGLGSRRRRCAARPRCRAHGPLEPLLGRSLRTLRAR